MKIVSISSARLAARIGSYLNAKRLADLIGQEAKIYWPPSGWEVNNSEEIFSQSFIDRTFVNKKYTAGLIPYNNLYEHYDIEKYKEYLSNENGIAIRNTRPIKIPEQDSGAILLNAPSLFSDEDLSPKMNEIVSLISSQMDGVFIGVHIRRGDILDYEAQEHLLTRYEPISVIIKALQNIEERNPGCRFIFASDDAAIRKTLIETFPAGREASSLADDIECTDLQAALRDMLILAKCKMVVGPRFSGFSSIGALMGGREREEFSTFINTDERIEAISRYVDEQRKKVPLGHLEAIDLAFLARALVQKKEYDAARQAIAQAEAISPDFVLFREMCLDINLKALHVDGTLEALRHLAEDWPRKTDARISFTRKYFVALKWLIPRLRALERHGDAAEVSCLGWRLHEKLDRRSVPEIRVPNLLAFYLVTGAMSLARKMAEFESLAVAKINPKEAYDIGRLAIELGESGIVANLNAYLQHFPDNPWTKSFADRLGLKS